MLEALIISGPLLLLVDEDPTSTLVVRTMLIVVLCWAVILPTFIPKFYATPESRRFIQTTRYLKYVYKGRDDDSDGNSSIDAQPRVSKFPRDSEFFRSNLNFTEEGISGISHSHDGHVGSCESDSSIISA